MTEPLLTAQIIAFPKPSPDRLNQALRNLDRALAQQREAVAEWQSSMRELRQSVTQLRSTLIGYDVALKSLAHNVGTLNQESRRLESWADDIVARQDPEPRAKTRI